MAVPRGTASDRSPPRPRPSQAPDIAGRHQSRGARPQSSSADIADGSRLVVIIAAPSQETSDRQIAEETAGIRAAGGEVVEIRPDPASGEAFGEDAMDGSRQPLVFAEGRRQGGAAAHEVNSRLERLAAG
jgi:hypothetical protein